MTQGEARQEIGTIARALLDGRITYIEGARKISELRFAAGLESDEDVRLFVGIDSETDELPIGLVRDLWQPAALAKIQPKIERAETWARELGRSACERFAERFCT